MDRPDIDAIVARCETLRKFHDATQDADDGFCEALNATLEDLPALVKYVKELEAIHKGEVLEVVNSALASDHDRLAKKLEDVERDDTEAMNRLVVERDRFAERCARLEAAIRGFLTAPSGTAICACTNRNAVTAGMESACAYCVARAALADKEAP